jgi:hypothetical protein
MSTGASRTIFITAAYFKQETVVDSNAEVKTIEKCILRAQDKFLMPLIGSQLFSSLINKITGQTVSGEYKILMDDYIIPCLMEYALWEYIPFSSFKFKNKGVGKQTSPDTDTADLKDLSYIRDNVRDSAQFYGERLIQHLRANTTAFPEYGTFINSDDVAPAKGDYFSGIQFPGMNRGNSSNGGNPAADWFFRNI